VRDTGRRRPRQSGDRVRERLPCHLVSLRRGFGNRRGKAGDHRHRIRPRVQAVSGLKIKAAQVLASAINERGRRSTSVKARERGMQSSAAEIVGTAVVPQVWAPTINSSRGSIGQHREGNRSRSRDENRSWCTESSGVRCDEVVTHRHPSRSDEFDKAAEKSVSIARV
jgi:hypothetical protein